MLFHQAFQALQSNERANASLQALFFSFLRNLQSPRRKERKHDTPTPLSWYGEELEEENTSSEDDGRWESDEKRDPLRSVGYEIIFWGAELDRFLKHVPATGLVLFSVMDIVAAIRDGWAECASVMMAAAQGVKGTKRRSYKAR